MELNSNVILMTPLSHLDFRSEHEADELTPENATIVDDSDEDGPKCDDFARRSMRRRSAPVIFGEEKSGDDGESQKDDRAHMISKGWTANEDEELEKRVRLHGEGNWKMIFDNSHILQQRYKAARSGKRCDLRLMFCVRVDDAPHRLVVFIVALFYLFYIQSDVARRCIGGRWRRICSNNDVETRDDESNDESVVASSSSTEQLHDRTTARRSMRKRSVPELYVARPSKLGVGVKDGDEELLAAMMTSSADNVKGEMKKETAHDSRISLAKSAAAGFTKYQNEFKTGGNTTRGHGDNGLQKNHSNWRIPAEDMELMERVRIHGEGAWAAILNSSHILQEKYSTAPSGTFNMNFCHDVTISPWRSSGVTFTISYSVTPFHT